MLLLLFPKIPWPIGIAALASLHQVPDQAAAQTGSVFQQDLIQRGGAKDLSISVSGFHSSHPSPFKTRSKTIGRIVF